ncbi:hypothetical protein ACFQMH_38470, partial [Streptomyces viridiviolaceus]
HGHTRAGVPQPQQTTGPSPNATRQAGTTLRPRPYDDRPWHGAVHLEDAAPRLGPGHVPSSLRTALFDAAWQEKERVTLGTVAEWLRREAGVTLSEEQLERLRYDYHVTMRSWLANPVIGSKQMSDNTAWGEALPRRDEAQLYYEAYGHLEVRPTDDKALYLYLRALRSAQAMATLKQSTVDWWESIGMRWGTAFMLDVAQALLTGQDVSAPWPEQALRAVQVPDSRLVVDLAHWIDALGLVSDNVIRPYLGRFTEVFGPVWGRQILRSVGTRRDPGHRPARHIQHPPEPGGTVDADVPDATGSTAPQDPAPPGDEMAPEGLTGQAWWGAGPSVNDAEALFPPFPSLPEEVTGDGGDSWWGAGPSANDADALFPPLLDGAFEGGGASWWGAGPSLNDVDALFPSFPDALHADGEVLEDPAGQAPLVPDLFLNDADAFLPFDLEEALGDVTDVPQQGAFEAEPARVAAQEFLRQTTWRIASQLGAERYRTLRTAAAGMLQPAVLIGREQAVQELREVQELALLRVVDKLAATRDEARAQALADQLAAQYPGIRSAQTTVRGGMWPSATALGEESGRTPVAEGREPAPRVRALQHRLAAGFDTRRGHGLGDDPSGTAMARILGPDVYGQRQAPPAPPFLRDYDFTRLGSAQRAAFFTAVDLTRPAPARAELRPSALPSDARTVVASQRGDIPKLAHTIWLGGPLTAEGATGEFRWNLERLATGRPDVTVVLWTDVTRAEFDDAEAGAKQPEQDGETGDRRTQVLDMLHWARAARVRLVNVDEVFSRTSPMALDGVYRAETARSTGAAYTAAAAILRLEVLDRFGGVYRDQGTAVTADLTAELRRVADSAHSFGVARHEGQPSDAVLIAPAGHPFLEIHRQVIRENYTRTSAENALQSLPARTDGTLPDVLNHTPRTARDEALARTGAGPTAWRTLARHTGLPDLLEELVTVSPEVFAPGSARTWPVPAPGEAAVTGAPRGTRYDPAKEAEAARRVLVTLVQGLHRQPGNLNLALVAPVVRGRSRPDETWDAVVGFLAASSELRGLVRSVTLTTLDGEPSRAVDTVVLPRWSRRLLLTLPGAPRDGLASHVLPARLLDPADLVEDSEETAGEGPHARRTLPGGAPSRRERASAPDVSPLAGPSRQRGTERADETQRLAGRATAPGGHQSGADAGGRRLWASAPHAPAPAVPLPLDEQTRERVLTSLNRLEVMTGTARPFTLDLVREHVAREFGTAVTAEALAALEGEFARAWPRRLHDPSDTSPAATPTTLDWRYAVAREFAWKKGHLEARRGTLVANSRGQSRDFQATVQEVRQSRARLSQTEVDAWDAVGMRWSLQDALAAAEAYRRGDARHVAGLAPAPDITRVDIGHPATFNLTAWIRTLLHRAPLTGTEEAEVRRAFGHTWAERVLRADRSRPSSGSPQPGPSAPLLSGHGPAEEAGGRRIWASFAYPPAPPETLPFDDGTRERVLASLSRLEIQAGTRRPFTLDLVREHFRWVLEVDVTPEELQALEREYGRRWPRRLQGPLDPSMVSSPARAETAGRDWRDRVWTGLADVRRPEPSLWDEAVGAEQRRELFAHLDAVGRADTDITFGTVADWMRDRFGLSLGREQLERLQWEYVQDASARLGGPQRRFTEEQYLRAASDYFEAAGHLEVPRAHMAGEVPLGHQIDILRKMGPRHLAQQQVDRWTAVGMRWLTKDALEAARVYLAGRDVPQGPPADAEIRAVQVPDWKAGRFDLAHWARVLRFASSFALPGRHRADIREVLGAAWADSILPPTGKRARYVALRTWALGVDESVPPEALPLTEEALDNTLTSLRALEQERGPGRPFTEELVRDHISSVLRLALPPKALRRLEWEYAQRWPERLHVPAEASTTPGPTTLDWRYTAAQAFASKNRHLEVPVGTLVRKRGGRAADRGKPGDLSSILHRLREARHRLSREDVEAWDALGMRWSFEDGLAAARAYRDSAPEGFAVPPADADIARLDIGHPAPFDLAAWIRAMARRAPLTRAEEAHLLDAFGDEWGAHVIDRLAGRARSGPARAEREPGPGPQDMSPDEREELFGPTPEPEPGTSMAPIDVDAMDEEAAAPVEPGDWRTTDWLSDPRPQGFERPYWREWPTADQQRQLFQYLSEREGLRETDTFGSVAGWVQQRFGLNLGPAQVERLHWEYAQATSRLRFQYDGSDFTEEQYLEAALDYYRVNGHLEVALRHTVGTMLLGHRVTRVRGIGPRNLPQETADRWTAAGMRWSTDDALEAARTYLAGRPVPQEPPPDSEIQALEVPGWQAPRFNLARWVKTLPFATRRALDDRQRALIRQVLGDAWADHVLREGRGARTSTEQVWAQRVVGAAPAVQMPFDDETREQVLTSVRAREVRAGSNAPLTLEQVRRHVTRMLQRELAPEVLERLEWEYAQRWPERLYLAGTVLPVRSTLDWRYRAAQQFAATERHLEVPAGARDQDEPDLNRALQRLRDNRWRLSREDVEAWDALGMRWSFADGLAAARAYRESALESFAVPPADADIARLDIGHPAPFDLAAWIRTMALRHPLTKDEHELLLASFGEAWGAHVIARLAGAAPSGPARAAQDPGPGSGNARQPAPVAERPAGQEPPGRAPAPAPSTAVPARLARDWRYVAARTYFEKAGHLEVGHRTWVPGTNDRLMDLGPAIRRLRSSRRRLSQAEVNAWDALGMRWNIEDALAAAQAYRDSAPEGFAVPPADADIARLDIRHQATFDLAAWIRVVPFSGPPSLEQQAAILEAFGQRWGEYVLSHWRRQQPFQVTGEPTAAPQAGGPLPGPVDRHAPVAPEQPQGDEMQVDPLPRQAPEEGQWQGDAEMTGAGEEFRQEDRLDSAPEEFPFGVPDVDVDVVAQE